MTNFTSLYIKIYILFNFHFIVISFIASFILSQRTMIVIKCKKSLFSVKERYSWNIILSKDALYCYCSHFLTSLQQSSIRRSSLKTVNCHHFEIKQHHHVLLFLAITFCWSSRGERKFFVRHSRLFLIIYERFCCHIFFLHWKFVTLRTWWGVRISINHTFINLFETPIQRWTNLLPNAYFNLYFMIVKRS